MASFCHHHPHAFPHLIDEVTGPHQPITGLGAPGCHEPHLGLLRMMAERDKPVHLVVDGLPTHKKAVVKQDVASTAGLLTLHVLPGDAPELNPDELVWSHT